MSFTFGAQTTTATGPAFGFGAKTTTPAFGLGSTTTTPSLFGTPQQQNTATGLTFGTPAAQQTTGLFGTATTAQATASPFGTPATQATGLTFGTPASTGIAFGTPASTGLSFGTSGTQQSTGFGAVATTTQTTGGFGAPAAATQSGTGFGSTPLFGSTPVQFGAAATTGQQFGAAATTGQPTLGGFGASATTSAAAPLSFGAQAATSTAAAPAFGSGSFSFGASSTTAATTATNALTFSTPTATTTSTGVSFGSQPFAAPTSQPFSSSLLSTTTSSSLFSTPTTTSTALGFGVGTATTKPLGLFATPTAATTSLPSFGSTTTITATTTTSLFTSFGKIGTTATTATTTSSIGLGGLDSTQTKGLTSSLTGATASRTESKTVKETAVPNELLQTVDYFKDFVKKQKACCSDVARSSPKTMDKVQEDLELLKQMLASVVSDLQRNVTLSSRLKADTDKCLQTVEMAQKTHDTPPGLQFENTAPDKYFEDLVTNFENQIQVFKQEVDKIEAHVNAVLTPKPMTSQELCLALKRLVDCFVALAGRLHTVHNMVENQKEQYLNLRKHLLKDTKNVFEEDTKKSPSSTAKTKHPVTVSTGPTAFSALGNQEFGLLSSAISKAQLPSSNPLGWSSYQLQNTSFQLQQPQQPLFSSGFGTTLFSGGGTSAVNTFPTPQPVENQGFQLQKPPVGNKRGKRI